MARSASRRHSRRADTTLYVEIVMCVNGSFGGAVVGDVVVVAGTTGGRVGCGGHSGGPGSVVGSGTGGRGNVCGICGIVRE